MTLKPFFVVMGVSGSGKSTIGRSLAQHLNCPFYDGDDFHPPENVSKMAAGSPLTDADRLPWLNQLHRLIKQHLEDGKTAVLACSALKRSYRSHLQGSLEAVQFIYLEGTFDLIWQRMQARQDHYMKAEMLRSQFDTLEKPAKGEAIIVNVEASVPEIVADILEQIAITL